ncbi:hypothetical protein PILCRDRAFT_810303 [Piloderma croceum F 1598]|uniref:Uncharacterized protein n=1 Tax=Piloderma croceum (strain F 1598) TaxID=765440 RepID=A0A0C3GL01_PILCF|nr:hypothetical protein PILCRDRAFT_810303 [Piloderma croceum F 1598]
MQSIGNTLVLLGAANCQQGSTVDALGRVHLLAKAREAAVPGAHSDFAFTVITALHPRPLTTFSVYLLAGDSGEVYSICSHNVQIDCLWPTLLLGVYITHLPPYHSHIG